MNFKNKQEFSIWCGWVILYIDVYPQTNPRVAFCPSCRTKSTPKTKFYIFRVTQIRFYFRMFDDLTQCFCNIRDNPDIRVVILTGGDSKLFSAGLDCKYFKY